MKIALYVPPILIWIGYYVFFYFFKNIYFLVFIFKFGLSKRNKQAFKVQDLLKENIFKYATVIHQ